MKKIRYDMFKSIETPTIILSTKYHNHLGVINNISENINVNFNMNSADEVSFDVYKNVDGRECDLWDDIVDFKYIYIPDHEQYYEISVPIDDGKSTIKHVSCKSAGESELSQKLLRDFHINDETDIGNDDYTITVFYNPFNKKGSLLDRVLKDKGSDWTIGHVDDTLKNIQRTFSCDGTSIYDFLINTVSQEIGCLFKFNSVSRIIDVYDLKTTCMHYAYNMNYPQYNSGRTYQINSICNYADITYKCIYEIKTPEEFNESHWIKKTCGFRGEFTEQCPRCGSSNKKEFNFGYGEFQNVFISTDNYANQIEITGDVSSVKNTFKIVGGDDLITATVANMNPTGTNYISRFSQMMYDDMPNILVKKLQEYDALYKQKLPEYTGLTEQYYDSVDDILYYQSSMMPDTDIPTDTTAEEQLMYLMSNRFKEVSVSSLSSYSLGTATNSVKGYGECLLDPRYSLDVEGERIDKNTNTWSGYLIVKSLGGVNEDGDRDEARSESPWSVRINDDYEEFLRQKIEKTLDRTSYGLTTIFKIDNIEDFKSALTLYSYDRLNSFANSYQGILEVLQKQGIGDETMSPKLQEMFGTDLYDEFYKYYWDRLLLISAESARRDATITDMSIEQGTIIDRMKAIQKELDLQRFLGVNYTTYLTYMREDTYTNSNYISTGLNNSQIISKTRELIDVAQDNLYKASELQYTLNGSLNNFLSTKEFQDFKRNFEIGDWIICQANNENYILRILSVSFDYGDIDGVNVTFSNVSKVNNFMSDIKSIIDQGKSMATSYQYYANQASNGDEAQNTVKSFLEEGLNSALYNIISGTNQDIKIDEHGIVAKYYDDELGDFGNEQLRITNNMIAFTDDNWKHASIGLGKHLFSRYDDDGNWEQNVEGYGLSAGFVQAGYINGSQMVAGKIYSEPDKNGKYITSIDLNNGTMSFGYGALSYSKDNGLFVKGKIDVDSGRIGGWTITNNSLYTSTVDELGYKYIIDENGYVQIEIIDNPPALKEWDLYLKKPSNESDSVIDIVCKDNSTGGETHPFIVTADGKLYIGDDGGLYISNTRLQMQEDDEYTNISFNWESDNIGYGIVSIGYMGAWDTKFLHINVPSSSTETNRYAKGIMLDGNSIIYSKYFRGDEITLNKVSSIAIVSQKLQSCRIQGSICTRTLTLTNKTTNSNGYITTGLYATKSRYGQSSAQGEISGQGCNIVAVYCDNTKLKCYHFINSDGQECVEVRDIDTDEIKKNIKVDNIYIYYLDTYEYIPSNS